ncbi:hypothetical protein D0Z03_003022 [Geotrichum reessii]|nr:hypothetical protein D0Z03_003022 [Galactomyces reessii]
METFLRQRHAERYSISVNSEDDDKRATEAAAELEEIELGTAKLETFMESVIDKSFDRFELYVLRNILVVPPDLVKGGWIRLAHQRGIDFTSTDTNNKDRPNGSDINTLNKDNTQINQSLSNANIIDLYTQLSVHKRANTILRGHKKRIDRLVASLEHFSTSFILPPVNGDTGGMPDDVRARFRAISPIAESLNFLATQVRAINEKVQELELVIQKLNESNNHDYGVNAGSRNLHAERDLFVDALTQRVVNMTGLGRSYPLAVGKDTASEPGVTDNEILIVPEEQIQEAQELVGIITK